MLKLHNVTKSYKHQSVLSNITYHLHDNELLSIIGEESSGNTTLLMIMATLKSIDTGELTFDDNDFEKNIKKNIRYVPNSILFYKHITIKSYLNMVMKLQKINNYTNINRLCEKFNIDISQKLSRMTYRDNKCISIIQALISNPLLLLIDQPYNYLDNETYKILQDELTYQNNNGMTIVVTSEDSSDVINFCSSYIYLQDGKIISTDSTQNCMNFPKIVTLQNIDNEKLENLPIKPNDYIYNDTFKHIFIYRNDTTTLVNKIGKMKYSNFLIESLTLEEYIFNDYARWIL